MTTASFLSAGADLSASLCASVRAPDVKYREVSVDGVKIAYREAGSPTDPTILLLHGVPSSSRMYDALLRKLHHHYHLIAFDYPGFGNSDAPSPDGFTYTFDNLADIGLRLTEALGLKRYALFMQDYGAPVGMRMAIARPASITGLIFQNGNIYEDGLTAYWDTRKAFWRDRCAHEQSVLDGHLQLAGIRMRHVGSDPDAAAYDPDLWMDEHAYLNRPGQAAIQAELIYDYRTNIAAYPAWQTWLRAHRPPTLVIWGRYDAAFSLADAHAFRGDLPDARIAILDAGHFAMDTRLHEVADLTHSFMRG